MPLNASAASYARSLAAPAPRRRWPPTAGTWAIIGVPILLVLVFVWQVGSTVLSTDIVVPQAAAISRVSLEADPIGSRIDMVVVDSVGRDTTVDATLNVKLHEPDGAVWVASRQVTAADFGPLPAGGLLAGRVGYSLLVPATDWVRAPRRGGLATVSIEVDPTDGSAVFSTVEQSLFP